MERLFLPKRKSSRFFTCICFTFLRHTLWALSENEGKYQRTFQMKWKLIHIFYSINQLELLLTRHQLFCGVCWESPSAFLRGRFCGAASLDFVCALPKLVISFWGRINTWRKKCCVLHLPRAQANSASPQVLWPSLGEEGPAPPGHVGNGAASAAST